LAISLLIAIKTEEAISLGREIASPGAVPKYGNSVRNSVPLAASSLSRVRMSPSIQIQTRNRIAWHEKRGQLADVNSYDVIIPTYPPHFHHVQAQLRSWQKNCIDVDRLQFTVVVSEGEVFDDPGLLGIKVRVHTMQWSKILDNNTEWFGNAQNGSKRHVLQSLKKLHGCQTSSSAWCFFTDSETVVIRQVYVHDLFDVSKPRNVVFNSRWTPNMYWKCVTDIDEILVPSSQRTEWMLDTYNWVYKRAEANMMLEIFHQKLNTSNKNFLDVFPCFNWFAEGTLYKLLKDSKATDINFIDSAELWAHLGIAESMLPRGAGASFRGCSMWECLGVLLMAEALPFSAIEAIAKWHVDLGIFTFNPRGRTFDAAIWEAFFIESNVSVLTSSDGHTNIAHYIAASPAQHQWV
jgi:hypothetical protein